MLRPLSKVDTNMSHQELQKLNDLRQKTWAAMRSTSDLAAQAGRDFTAAEEQTWQRQNDELARIDSRISTTIEADRRDADIVSTLGHYGPGTINDSEVRAVLAGDQRHCDLAIDLERRDILKSSNGAYVVPQGFSDQMVEAMLQAAVVAGVATKFTTASGTGDLMVPAATAHPSAALTAEAASITESQPTFAQITLTSYKYASFVQASTEVLEDSGINIEAYLARRCGEAVGRQLGANLVTGTGSSQPQGIVVGSSLGVTAASATAITMDEVLSLLHSVAPQYRQKSSCAFLMADATALKLRTLKATGSGDYIWQPSVQAGQPDSLLGYPVYVDPTMPAATTGLKSVLFGDMSAYGVRFTGPVRFERSDDFAFQNDLATFRCAVRADGRMLDTSGAIKHLIQA